jgi:hypothetical protein
VEALLPVACSRRCRSYQYAAAAGKRHRLREARVWIDPPEYYDPPGGLLAFTLSVPHELIYPAGGMSVQGHIVLIKRQLAQLRAALALAHALGRKLVLPSVTCGYDAQAHIASQW